MYHSTGSKTQPISSEVGTWCECISAETFVAPSPLDSAPYQAPAAGRSLVIKVQLSWIYSAFMETDQLLSPHCTENMKHFYSGCDSAKPIYNKRKKKQLKKDINNFIW